MRTTSTLLHYTNDQLSQLKTSSQPPTTLNNIVHHSPWHSPMAVYLFGGLAAMLGLIAFALLVLSCTSYLKLDRQDGDTDDVESGGAAKKGESNKDSVPAIFDEKYLVIMAGEVNPTFLATPVSLFSSDQQVCNKENIKEKVQILTEGNIGEESVESQVSQQQRQ